MGCVVLGFLVKGYPLFHFLYIRRCQDTHFLQHLYIGFCSLQVGQAPVLPKLFASPIGFVAKLDYAFAPVIRVRHIDQLTALDSLDDDVGNITL